MSLISSETLLDQLVALHPFRRYFTSMKRVLQCAAWIILMSAIAKFTMAKKGAELDKPLCDVVFVKMDKPEFSNARRINKLAAAGKEE